MMTSLDDKTVRQPGSRLAAGRPSRTAEITAQMRAADARVPRSRRLVDDRYARLFVTNRWYRVLRMPVIALIGLRAFDRGHAGFLAEILLRTRHFDDELVAAYRRGVRQVVLLGAGYDSSALRHPEMADMIFYEVDHPATQQVKTARLARYRLATPNVRYTPVDLESGDRLSDALVQAGFDRARPCLIGWHGVSFFLRREAFHSALAEMAGFCAPGSRLVFDYMDESVVDGTTTYEGARRGAANVAATGEPYKLGLNARTATEAAERAGFTHVSDIRVRDLVRRYGGARPYCRDDDFMGLVTVERATPA